MIHFALEIDLAIHTAARGLSVATVIVHQSKKGRERERGTQCTAKGIYKKSNKSEVDHFNVGSQLKFLIGPIPLS